MTALSPKRLSAALDPKTNRLRLAATLWHPTPWLRVAATSNPSTPRAAKHTALRQPYLAPHILRGDRHIPVEVLRKYAQRKATTPSTLSAIVTHPNADDSVRLQVVKHWRSNLSHMSAVVVHTDSETMLTVAWERAVKLIEAGKEKDAHCVEFHRRTVQNDACPTAILHHYAHTSTDRQVLEGVAQHVHAIEGDRVVAALRCVDR